MISALDYKILSYIADNPGQDVHSEGLKNLLEGHRCGSVGANLIRLEGLGYIERVGRWNTKFSVTAKGEEERATYYQLVYPRALLVQADWQTMYEQMEDLASTLFLTLLEVPNHYFENGNTDELGTVDEGAVLHAEFMQRAADILRIDLTKPIEMRVRK